MDWFRTGQERNVVIRPVCWVVAVVERQRELQEDGPDGVFLQRAPSLGRCVDHA